MEFVFDLYKSEANEKKHGINFEEAKSLWLDPNAIMGPADSRTENRFVVVGRIGDKVWAAIITFRGPSIRIISVRRAQQVEQQVYEQQ
jgi:uncharacterized DUF497 family protein